MGLYWIRPATTGDASAIAHVHNLSFGQPLEAQLVEALDREGLNLVSLVAERDGTVIGHILFTRVVMSTGALTASLAPVAVLPEHQNKGAGSALVRAGLEGCRQLGVRVVVVLGHPEYYPRFGFSAASGRKLVSPYAAHGDAWMAMEVVPGTIPDSGASIEYPAVWSAFS
jgi:putative acetyltransferase